MTHVDSDDPLVRAARSGDTIAFGELVKRHSRACFRLAAKTLGNAEDAEDVVQEAFTRAYQGLPRFRGDASFRTWILHITHHLTHDHLRSRRRRISAETLSPEFGERDERNDDGAGVSDRSAGPARDSAGRDDVAVLRRALDELPLRQKTALLLKVYDGLSYSETARVLGTSVGAARVYLALARRALRRRFARWWTGGSGSGS